MVVPCGAVSGELWHDTPRPARAQTPISIPKDRRILRLDAFSLFIALRTPGLLELVALLELIALLELAGLFGLVGLLGLFGLATTPSIASRPTPCR